MGKRILWDAVETIHYFVSKKFNVLIMNLAKVGEMRTCHNSWDFWMTDIYNFGYFMFMREIKKKKSCILIQVFTDNSDLIFTHYICT